MQANFEVKYLDVKWYDQDTILSIQESFISLKVEFDDDCQRFVCNSVIYPKADGIKHGQLAFRYLERKSSVPYVEIADGGRIPLKKVVDKKNGNEWWIEANFWIANIKRWESKAGRTAGKLVVGLQDQLCQINIGSSAFTTEELERYLSDFKSDLWELILDDSSYVTGKIKETQKGGVTEESIHMIGNVLSHAQKILNNPKSELREIQTLKPRKMVRPVTRTFMELATKNDNRFLTSRATKPSYNVPENRYLLFALERIYKILKQLVRVSENKEKRFDATAKKLSERYYSFGDEELVDVNLVRKDLEKLKKSYDLDELNYSLHCEVESIFHSKSSGLEWRILYFRIKNKRDLDGYYVDFKEKESDLWCEERFDSQIISLVFDDECYQKLFEKNLEYEIEAKIINTNGFTKKGVPWFGYKVVEIRRIKIMDEDGVKKRREKFQSEKRKAVILKSKGWKKDLTNLEKNEQKKEQASITRQWHFYEDQRKNSKKVHDLLEPKLAKFDAILKDLKRLEVKPLSTFPNSMTFVQNPSYQAVHSGYKSLQNLTNLTDEDLLLSLEKIDEIGLINMPILYERWCLLQIIKVLIQKYHYVPEDDWKRKLVKIVSMGRHGQKEGLGFNNSEVKRNIKLMYEFTLENGKVPDFVMDVNFERKDGSKHAKRFVMDAKFYSEDMLKNSDSKNYRGISDVVNELYHGKNYSENGENAVFIIHPVKNAIAETERVSPQSWAVNSFLGELEMFAWDKPLRKKHYHKYGAIYASPVVDYLDEFQRLLGMFLQFGIENNQFQRNSDDVESVNFCVACGSHNLTEIKKKNHDKYIYHDGVTPLKSNGNSKSIWYKCNDCEHFATYNHCNECGTRLIKNGAYWSYHSQMPMEPLNIKCPACESLL